MERRAQSFFLISAVITVSFFLSSVTAGSAVAADADKETCVTASCHNTMGKAKFVHGPVGTRSCTVCHLQVRKHAFQPITDIAQVCYECHERVDTRRVVHPPVKEGKCLMCHDPHQSPHKFQLRASGADLCFLCHDKSIAGGAFLHGPVASGSCGSCHSAHQGDFPKLLSASGNDVCFGCHADKAEALGKKFVHKPVREACIACHNPHGGKFRHNLKADGAGDLCFTCHTEKEKEIREAKVKHKGLDTGKKCLACHDPHASQQPKQLLQEPADLCLSCHNREYGQGNDKLANIKDVLNKNSSLHGPVRDRDCSSCHNTHGSNNFRILRENFPPVFYAGYKEENYQLCFMCHEKTLASEEKTTTVTGFRNGFQNLHFVHVNKVEKGRTCRACHDAHATNNPRHIRDGVPFGKWKLPIEFVKTETGGRCIPGCHKPFGYDRINPVENQ